MEEENVKDTNDAIIEPDYDKKRSGKLEKLKQEKDILLMLYSKKSNGDFHTNMTQKDEITVYELLRDKKSENRTVLIYLDTPGGNVYSAVKIMDMLRKKYETIEIAIAQEAKSSGTMMCLAADKLIMSCVSELGPLDKPMKHPKDEMMDISAMDIVNSLDKIIDTAIDKQKILANDLINNYRITTEKGLEIAGKIVTSLILPIVSKEDIIIYNRALRLLSITEIYGKELLRSHMLKNIRDDKLRDEIAEIIIDKLVWKYPDHGFAIRREELRKNWFFNIENEEENPLPSELWDIFKSTIGNTPKKTINYL
jgi:ATP-dependent protease ClpP protease subunit